MDSKTTKQFRDCLGRLPTNIQKRAEESYRLFKSNPQHPGLQFKKIHTAQPIYSARISLDYRAIGIIQDDTIVWFWIGPHADHERLMSSQR